MNMVVVEAGDFRRKYFGDSEPNVLAEARNRRRMARCKVGTTQVYHSIF
jgi:hypothetical protein